MYPPVLSVSCCKSLALSLTINKLFSVEEILNFNSQVSKKLNPKVSSWCPTTNDNDCGEMTRDRADLTSSGHSGLRSSLSFHFRFEQRISLKGHKLNLRRSLLKRFWETTPLSYRQGQIKGSLVLQTFVGRDGLLIVCLQKISINHSRKPTYKNALLQSSIADYSHRMKTRLQRKMLNFCSKNILRISQRKFYHLFNVRC